MSTNKSITVYGSAEQIYSLCIVYNVHVLVYTYALPLSLSPVVSCSLTCIKQANACILRPLSVAQILFCTKNNNKKNKRFDKSHACSTHRHRKQVYTQKNTRLSFDKWQKNKLIHLYGLQLVRVKFIYYNMLNMPFTILQFQIALTY